MRPWINRLRWCLLLSFAFGLDSLGASALLPLPVSLNAFPPSNWKFKAPQGQAIQSLVRPGFQGHIEPLKESVKDGPIFEISIFAFQRSPDLGTEAQIEAAFHAVFPNDLGAKAKISNRKSNRESVEADRTIEVPYGSSAVTTLLHARVGKKTVVVIEAVVRGRSVDNASLNSIRKLIPEVTYTLN